MIVFDEILKTYGDTVVLNRVSFQIKAGEFVCVTGKSGAGKTTIAKLLLAIEKPDGGHVTVDGIDIHNLKGNILQMYRRKAGMVFQDYQLLEHKTAFENISFALEVSGVPRREIKSRVVELIDLTHLSGLEDHFPAQLSGGEKQRVAIARALVHNPKLIIADEPTGNLDRENTWDIVSLLQKINSLKTTVILTTHDLEIVSRINERQIHIEDGLIVSPS